MAVDASANTAFVKVRAEADSKVSYSITGTDGKDTLILNATGGSLVGGAEDDVLTDGAGNDTIDGGTGDDHIDLSTGTDTVTGGEGKDTFDMANTGTTAVQQVSTLAAAALDTVYDIDELLTVTVNGVNYVEAFDTNHDKTLTNFVTSHATALAAAGITVTRTVVATTTSDDSLVFTGPTSGAAFTISATGIDGGAMEALPVTATTTAIEGVTQLAKVQDFEKGDIFDLADIMTEATVTYYEGAASAATATATVMVLTDPGGFADAEAAEDAIIANAQNSTVAADSIIVFINSALGYAQMVRDPDGDNAANATNLGGTTGANVIVDLVGITNVTQLAAAFSDASFSL